MKWVTDLHVADKRVFVRVDYNVPIDDAGEPTDDVRLTASLPTLRYLLDNKAKVIVASHLGRPGGGVRPTLSLIHVAERLAALIGRDVLFPEDCVGDAARKLAHDLKSGDILMLENLRFHAEEEKDDPAFSAKLASLAEVYVNDAFGTLHRSHASTVGMVKKFSEKGAGLLIRAEITPLSRLLHPEEHPFVVILGGAKVGDKIALLESLLGRVDTFLLGGALALTFLAAGGVRLGQSTVEETKLHVARRFLDRAAAHRAKVVLPVDHIAGQPGGLPTETRECSNTSFPVEWTALDIGPRTRQLFAEALDAARLVFWNGPVGLFEQPPFAAGTFAVAEALSRVKGFVVVGGGDSAAALQRSGLADRVSHISTGGGASLEYIRGMTLPGLAALEA